VAKGDEFLMRGGPTSKWKPIQWPREEVSAWVLEGGAHHQEGGSHVCERERAWGPHEVRCHH
jgi:hypothetical protein